MHHLDRRRAAPRALLLLALLLTPSLGGCVHARLAADQRRPYSKQSTTLEDLGYTVEKGGEYIAKGLFIVMTLGLLGLSDDDDEDDDDDCDRPDRRREDPRFPNRVTGRRRSR